MKRVLLIGSPGSGKTTFAKKLAKKVNLPLIHLDYYYHDKTKDYYHEQNKEAWCAQVNELIAKNEWIIDGNYNSTLAERVARADTIIFFDVPRRTALYSAIKRSYTTRGMQRDDLPADWSEALTYEFVKYIWHFNREKRPKIKAIILTAEHADVLIFTSRKQADEYLELI